LACTFGEIQNMRFSWFFLGVTILFSCSSNRESTKPSRQTIVNTVYSSVIIEPVNVYKVNSTISGNIEDILVQEGDLVKKGDILFLLSNNSNRINQQNAQLNYQFMVDSYVGKNNLLEELKLSHLSAKMAFQNDSINAVRFQNLYAQNACSKIDLERAVLTYKLSQTHLKSIKQSISRKENELKNQVGQSRNNLQISALKSADGIITSNIDGKLFQLFKEKGEYVSLQESIAILGDKNQFILKMLIDEVDIPKIKIGQQVWVELEAYKGKVYEAKVTKIAPKMNEKTQTFELEAQFKSPPTKLYMGLTGEGNIVLHTKQKALVIPRDYLLPGNKVETEKGLVSVTIGLANWDVIEILSGITENTLIYKPQ
jgi:HlyD family secretion protein